MAKPVVDGMQGDLFGQTANDGVDDSEFFVEPKQWSLEKLTILQHYLEPWGNKLGMISRDLAYVDAFAGRGAYLDRAGTAGSPVRAAEASRTLAGRGRNLTCLVIEAKRKYFNDLKARMEPYADIATVKCGTLEQHQDLVLEFCGEKPAFIFLDPFGTKGIEFDIVQRLMSRRVGDWPIPTDLMINFSVPGIRRRAGMVFRDEDWAVSNVKGLARVLDDELHFAEELIAGMSMEQVVGNVLSAYLGRLQDEFDAYAYAFPMRRYHGGPIQFWLISVARHPDAPILFNDQCHKSGRRLHALSHKKGNEAHVQEAMDSVWDQRTKKAAADRLPATLLAAAKRGQRTLEQFVLDVMDRHDVGTFAKKHVGGEVRKLVRAQQLSREDPRERHEPFDPVGIRDDDRFSLAS